VFEGSKGAPLSVDKEVLGGENERREKKKNGTNKATGALGYGLKKGEGEKHRW